MVYRIFMPYVSCLLCRHVCVVVWKNNLWSYDCNTHTYVWVFCMFHVHSSRYYENDRTFCLAYVCSEYRYGTYYTLKYYIIHDTQHINLKKYSICPRNSTQGPCYLPVSSHLQYYFHARTYIDFVAMLSLPHLFKHREMFT